MRGVDSEEQVELVEGVRTPVAIRRETKRRTFDERIGVRFPALARVLASAWSRLSPRSRLRRVILARFIRKACEAVNRRDFDALFLGLDPEIELHWESPIGDYVAPDLLGVHRGHEGYRRVWESGIEAMSDLRLEIEEVVDYGDRLVTAGRNTGHGTSSGVPVDQPVFQVLTLRRGLVMRQEDFTERDKAIEAARLPESGG